MLSTEDCYINEEMLSKTVFDVRALDQRDETIMALGLIMKGETDFCSSPFVTKSGEQIPVETLIKLGLWNGESRFFAVSKDISQIKLSEEKFSAAFQSNSAIMVILNCSEEQVIDVNDAFVSQLGYSRQEAIGKIIVDLDILQDSSLHSRIVEAIMNNSEISEHDIVIQTKIK